MNFIYVFLFGTISNCITWFGFNCQFLKNWPFSTYWTIVVSMFLAANITHYSYSKYVDNDASSWSLRWIMFVANILPMIILTSVIRGEEFMTLKTLYLFSYPC
jgi:hypothetical protein